MFKISDTAKTDGVLRCVFPTLPDFVKSDGFMFVLDRHMLIHDGGMPGSRDLLSRMLEVKEAVSPDAPMHVVWVLSHFHIDHVSAVLDTVMPDPGFIFDRIYTPSSCSLPEGTKDNGDEKYRPRLAEALKRYQPSAAVTETGFADRGCGPVRFFFPDEGEHRAEITLYPPDCDWADPSLIERVIVNGYFGGDANSPRIGTCVINSASLWMKISYAGRRILFTGDCMKRTTEITDESFDRMLSLWADSVGDAPDLMKWPHHGMARDHAMEGVLSLHPKNILTTTLIETASKHTAKNRPDYRGRFFNCAEKEVRVSVGPDGSFEIGQVK